MTILNMSQISDLQWQIKVWCDHNFPNTPPHRPLLGIQEEVGELSHAHLKMEQEIRGTAEEHIAAKADAVGDIVIYLCDYCTKNELDLEFCIMTALEEIRKRDWIKFPKNGRTE